ncbi:alanine/glycine:cation symporter family protein [Gabonibacter chumensis]|uniref:alanine/glycine:cation symporter family protein n=1 Tax=Gabonibacter chumensis TaxID=2972474 RepID=UPI0025740637|nr:alanine/glycine:cation symporter family protein [Gabonibacter chumensis]MCR9012229.1 alanine:cation symporter family protein [Gabonibacter chumensis]
MDKLNNWIIFSNDFIWTYFLIVPLIAIGLYFTFLSRFVQFRNFREMFRLLGEGITSGKSKNSVSSFQAFCIATASRVGTGNLAGVATALALGGPGAVFWMWLIALIGSASAFIESTLAQIYKAKGERTFIGGPAFYMEKGLKKRSMGILFAVIISITFGLVFNSVQANTVTLAFHEVFGIDRTWLGILLTIFTLLVIFGGIHRIAVISGILVPLMAIAYILVALFILFMNAGSIPHLITTIFADAFGFEQFAGGGLGVVIMQGIRRGLFSNEAGMGSAPNAAATADVSHPVKQGLIQSLSVFTDTIIICSCTAFIILLSDIPLDGTTKGIQLTQMALSHQIGPVGGQFIAISILLFAFSSIVGNYSYCETNMIFISPKQVYLQLYRVAVGLMVLFGSWAALDLVWNLADLAMAVMTIINLIAIVLLGKIALKALKDYHQQKKSGIHSPAFKSKSIPELKDSTSEWQ